MKLRVLLESLSYSDALKLFNLDKDYTENDVLKKYKRLAIKLELCKRLAFEECN